MRFKKYGNEDGQTLMLIHGMATTGHACFDRIIPLLNTYCIILCEVDDHYSNSSYISLNKCCEEIEKYITDNIKQFKGTVLFMHGTNEPFPKKSLGRLKKYIPNIKSQVIDKMGHGQFLHDKPEEYAGPILKYFD